MSLDGFFFDVEKWFGSVAAQRMSFAEKGVYLSMLFQEWRDASRSLPDDPQAVADLIAVSDAQAADVLAAWSVVRRKFVLEERTKRISNVALERTRRAQAANRRKHVDAGREGGKRSAAKRQEQRELDSKHRSSDAVAKATDEKRVDKKRLDESREEEIQAFRALWNARTLPPIPRCDALSEKRRKHVRIRLQERSLQGWGLVFDRIAASPFCNGQNDRQWTASIDWVLERPDTAIKVLEGKYDKRVADIPVMSDTMRHNIAVTDEFQRQLLEREGGGREH